MIRATKACVEQHFPDKVKVGTAVPPDAWFDAADAALLSARTVLARDPVSAGTLGWSAMHKIAKGIVAAGGLRLENETHGKIVDFLHCVFVELTNEERGVVRAASTERNTMSYDDPRQANPRAAEQVLALTERMLTAARDETEIAPPKRRIPPPPPST